MFMTYDSASANLASAQDDFRVQAAMITAVIVNYNSGALLTACVASLFASSCPVRVVVSDNASNDDSLDRLQAFFGDDPRIEIVRNPENLGFSGGCNLGLDRAAGDYVLFINPDCVIPPDAIERMRALMAAHPEAGMAGCLIRNLDGSEQVGCRRYVPTPWRSLVRVLRLDRLFPRDPRFQTFNMAGTPLPDEAVPVEAISGAFMFVRLSALELVGPLDEYYFLHCEDLDWCMRFRLAGYAILFEPGVAITHLKGGSQASAAFVEWHKHKGMARFYRRFFRDQYPLVLMLLVISAVWARFAMMLPYLLFRRGQGGHPGVRAAYECDAKLWRTAGSTHASRTVIVSGATSQIGRFLLPRLAAAGYRVIALSRTGAPDWKDEYAGETFWLRADIRDGASLVPMPSARTLIHLAPLVILPQQIEAFSALGVRRVIAFGSSSRHSKAESPVDAERAYARRLVDAEQALAERCGHCGMRWTVFRPTLVYGRGMDRNITLIRRLVRITGFFPLLGDGSGLRQPVHADDLAAACVAALDNPLAFDKAYDLSGGETLSYRAMVGRIFDSLSHKPRFLSIPQALFTGALRVLSLIPRYRDFNVAMAQRMNEDLVYEHHEATRDFGFRPKKFTP
ncbi:N-acetylglucosaminyl-diphospho-decaprenol L-rhamnosyltransferase [mine drainage metagenome]|uniref:N-acetylglucosaminyl-diphospho-decaprenol L-rhamnosyltransferase n=1 Tax=mine drainage metagenome TaxID=410659 RepID=A0A1J5SFT3_9ZZZZ